MQAPTFLAAICDERFTSPPAVPLTSIREFQSLSTNVRWIGRGCTVGT